jgi:predicted ester cyclase
MASKNVETYRKAHEAFNARKWGDVTEHFTATATYTDHPRAVSTKGPVEFLDWLKEWTTAFTDAKIQDVEYIDAGEWVIARFLGTGHNDGALGPMPPTGKRMSMEMCEMMRFDSRGNIVEGGIFYDQLTMLQQLGHIPPM